MANLQNPTAPQLSEEDKKKQTWGEYGRQVYNEQYERWMPWIEDFYLRWFTRDNKTSYAAKGELILEQHIIPFPPNKLLSD